MTRARSHVVGARATSSERGETMAKSKFQIEEGEGDACITPGLSNDLLGS